MNGKSEPTAPSMSPPLSTATIASSPATIRTKTSSQVQIHPLLEEHVAIKSDHEHVKSQIERYSTIADSLAWTHHAMSQVQDKSQEARWVEELMRGLDRTTDMWREHLHRLQGRVRETARIINAGKMCSEVQYSEAMAIRGPLDDLSEASDVKLRSCGLQTLSGCTKLEPADIVRIVSLRNPAEQALLHEIVKTQREVADLEKTLVCSTAEEDSMLDSLSAAECFAGDAETRRRTLDRWRELILRNERTRCELDSLKKQVSIQSEEGGGHEAPARPTRMESVVRALEVACEKYNETHVD